MPPYEISAEEFELVMERRLPLFSPVENVPKDWKYMRVSERSSLVADACNGVPKTSAAASLGISVRNVVRYLKVNELSPELKARLDNGSLSIAEATRTIPVIAASLPSPASILAQNLNEDDLEPQVYENLTSSLGFDIPTPGPRKTSDEPVTTFDTAFEVFRDWVGAYQPPVICPSKTPTAVKRVVSINDLHCPDHDEDALAEFIYREKGKVDQLVISGDLAHFETMSRFEKFTKKFSPVEEVQKTKIVLNLLAENFPNIVYFGGNHDARPMNYFAKSMPADILDYIRMVGPGVLSPVDFMIADLPNVHMAPTIKLHTSAEYKFLYQIDDLILGHPEVYSQVNLKAGADFVDWLMRYATPRGLIKPFKFAAMGHTHQAGKVWCDYGKIAMEMGCMCHDGDYTGSAKIRGARRPWKLGYTVFEIENGVTNEETSNFIPLQLK